jgi:small-conductance mechanosensitive channel/CRP-like cAMP-binding protein
MNSTLLPAAALVAITAIGLLSLRRFSDRVRFIFDVVVFIAVSAYLWRKGISPFFPPPDGPLSSAALWMRAIGGAWWLLGSRIFVAILWYGVHRDQHARQTTLFSDLFGGAVYIAAALVILNSVFALPVTGLLATSGVLAIVLGLALQNTLADVFAGMAVGVEAPFSVGDRIQIDDKIEGQVVQVNWRSIRIQTDGDDIAIIPNSHIAKAEIINRSFPGQRRAASVDLSCPENANPESIIEALRHATMLCTDILGTPEPKAVLSQLRPKRNAYKIMFFVESTKQLGPTKDALLRSARRQLYYAGFLDRNQQFDVEKNQCRSDFAIRRILQDLILLQCLSSAEIEGLASKSELRLLEPGEKLFAQASKDATLYVLASGILEFTRQLDALPVETIGRMGAGDYVGEIGLLTGAAHATTATAITHCRIYHLTRDAIAPLLKAKPDLASAFDKSARHGLDILHRQVTARAIGGADVEGQLLPRIRNFFHFGLS